MVAGRLSLTQKGSSGSADLLLGAVGHAAGDSGSERLIRVYAVGVADLRSTSGWSSSVIMVMTASRVRRRSVRWLGCSSSVRLSPHCGFLLEHHAAWRQAAWTLPSGVMEHARGRAVP